jgi:hypothetical protein
VWISHLHSSCTFESCNNCSENTCRITTLKTWKEENHLTFESVGWFHFILFIYIYSFIFFSRSEVLDLKYWFHTILCFIF